MAFCVHCGAASAGGSFCTECGAAVGGNSASRLPKSTKAITPTSAENKVIILSELWLNYRYDEQFTDFVEYNDLTYVPHQLKFFPKVDRTSVV
jgi:hypothetical protein